MGGFSSSTLAEDFDLTLNLIKKGYSVRFAESAIAYTEAPTSLIQLIKQRFRWNFGNLQVYSKYQSMIGNRKYKATGLIFLPRAVILQIFLTLTMPFVDIFILLNLLMGERQLTMYFLVFYLVFYFVIAIFSHSTLKESLKAIVYIPLLRFGYTQILYIVFYHALIKALRGQLVQWTKIHHEGELTYLSNSSG